MNKKAEGTASSMFMALFMVTMALVLFGSLVVNMVGSYDDFDTDLAQVSKFQEYQQIYNEMNQTTSEFVTSQNANQTGRTLFDRIEDNIFWQGFKAILTFPKLLGNSMDVFQVTMSEIGFSLPSAVWTFLVLLLGFGTVLLVIIAYWRWNRV